MLKPFQFQDGWTVSQWNVQMTYRSFPADIMANLWGYMYFGEGRERREFRPPRRMPGGCSDGDAALKRDGVQADEQLRAEPPNEVLGGRNDKQNRPCSEDCSADKQARAPATRPGVDLGQVAAQESQRDGLLLPAPHFGRRWPGAASSSPCPRR